MFRSPWLVFVVGAFIVVMTDAFAADIALTVTESKPIGTDGSMVTCWNANLLEKGQPVDLLIHFHGAAPVVSHNFTESKIDAVLVVINFNGLSAAYAKPFRESPDLFNAVLDNAANQLGGSPRIQWGRVSVSSFSAGYGAVREILKTPEYFERINAVVAADSMYASLEKETEARQPLKAHMRDYARFAKLAADRKKTFVITHTSQETAYASTTETADYLLKSVGISREAMSRSDGDALLLKSKATKGKFTVLGYQGTTGNDHMQHLRQIHLWWKQL